MVVIVVKPKRFIPSFQMQYIHFLLAFSYVNAKIKRFFITKKLFYLFYITTLTIHLTSIHFFTIHHSKKKIIKKKKRIERESKSFK